MIDNAFPRNERDKIENDIIKDLSQNNIDDKYFVLMARKYLSHFKSQHTTINLASTFEKIYPYVIHFYENKWFVLNIDSSQDSSFIGKEIIKINNLGVSEVEQRLSGFTFGENQISQEHELENIQLYNKPLYLKEINVIQDVSEVISLTFSDSTSIKIIPTDVNNIGLYSIKLPSHQITKPSKETYFYKLYADRGFGYLQFNKCHDKIDMLEGIDSYVKPWMQPFAKRYLKRQFKKTNPSKQVSQYYNPEHPIFKDYIWQMIDSLNANKTENLIIDLRNNSGGNLKLGIQLMYFLTDQTSVKGFKEYAYTSDIYKKYFIDDYKELGHYYPEGVPDNKLVLTKQKSLFEEITNPNSVYYIPTDRPVFNGNVFVLANFNTSSAAAMLTTLIQDNEIGTVIGTSVANNPTGATTWTPFVLPKTKAKVSIATTYIERPIKSKGKIQIPDYWVEYTLDNIIEGKDPYLDKAIELMPNR